ncbi:BatA domain-containing protein [uncultured Hymenobacter sp.]|uniref:BatA domain-containing protein n=1 Tax=uncultured Hymenobacter sp. TaxID=170016 RepID=UPI0035CC7510
MFTLLNPAALLALLGLLVPVAIHLWNRRPGREVAVGSLRWLAAGANRRLRNLKLEQLWLLLLRAALLAVLALAVAGPAWRQSLPPARGQVLLSPALIGNPALAALRPTIDSLRRRGYGLRWLAAGFPRLSGAAWRADSARLRDSARVLSAADSVGAAWQWARVRQAGARFAGQPLYVLTPAALAGFRGTHAPLAASITWQLVPAGAPSNWVHQATFWGDSLRLLLGHSSEIQTTFQLKSVARPQPGAEVRVAGLPPLRLVAGAGGPQLAPLAPTPPPAANATSTTAPETTPLIPVRTRPVRIILYATPAFAADARCLQAGLRAAAVGLPAPLDLRVVAAPPDTATAPDWLFWLSDAPLPAAWQAAVRGGTRVWQEAAAPGIADPARLVGAAGEAAVTMLRRSAPSVPAAGVPLWTDGRGRAVLARRELGQGAFYQLHTRLSPAWSELAESPDLPARLLTLLAPAPTDEAAPVALPPYPAPTTTQALTQKLAAYDQRALDPAQLYAAGAGRKRAARPVASGDAEATPPAFRLTDLRPWLVLVAGLLFALERWLAWRRTRPALSSVAASAAS